MNNETKYVKVAELPQEVQVKVAEALKVNKQIRNLEKKVEAQKLVLTPVKDLIKGYLLGQDLQGVDANKQKLFLQEGTTAPSFKQVLAELEGELPNTVVAKLEAKYAKLVESGKNWRLVIR